MDQRDLVREEAFLRAQALEVLGDADGGASILQGGERVPETRQHDRAVGRRAHRLFESCDRLASAPKTLQRPPCEEVAPVERRFHPNDLLGLRQRIGIAPRHVMVPGDVRVHQGIQRVELHDLATGGERLGKPSGRTQRV